MKCDLTRVTVQFKSNQVPPVSSLAKALCDVKQSNAEDLIWGRKTCRCCKPVLKDALIKDGPRLSASAQFHTLR